MTARSAILVQCANGTLHTAELGFSPLQSRAHRLHEVIGTQHQLRLVRPFPRSGAFSTRMSPMGVPFSSDSLTESEIGVQPTADMRAVDDAYLDTPNHIFRSLPCISSI